MARWPLQTLAVCNQKGGVGKTTTAANLACGLALRGYKTCLVDNDAQRNASAALGVDILSLAEDGSGTVIEIFADAKPAIDVARPVERPEGSGREQEEVRDLLARNLSVIPAHAMISGFGMQAETMVFQAAARGASFEDQQDMRQEFVDRLRESLKTLNGHFDVCIIDTPPSLGFMLTAALRASDWLLIPLTCSAYCKSGVSDLMTTVSKVTARGNPRLRLFRAVLGMYDSRKVMHQQDLEFYRAQFGEGLHSTCISQGVRVEELPSHKKSVFEHAPDSEQAKQFGELTDAFIKEVDDFLELQAERLAKRTQQAHSDTLIPMPPGAATVVPTAGEPSGQPVGEG